MFSLVRFVFLIFLLAVCGNVKAVRKKISLDGKMFYVKLSEIFNQPVLPSRQEKILFSDIIDWWCVSYIAKVVTKFHLKLRATNYPRVTGMTQPCYRSYGQLETGDLLNFLFKLIKNIFEVPGERKVRKTPVYFHYLVQYHSSGGQNWGWRY